MVKSKTSKSKTSKSKQAAAAAPVPVVVAVAPNAPADPTVGFSTPLPISVIGRLKAHCAVSRTPDGRKIRMQDAAKDALVAYLARVGA